jgi:hypothetical protein
MSDIRINIVKEALVAQNPEDFYSVDAIVSIMYMPFYLPSEKEASNQSNNFQGRTSLMVGNAEEKQDQLLKQSPIGSSVMAGKLPRRKRTSSVTASSENKPVIPESSNRWPISYNGAK